MTIALTKDEQILLVKDNIIAKEQIINDLFDADDNTLDYVVDYIYLHYKNGEQREPYSKL